MNSPTSNKKSIRKVRIYNTGIQDYLICWQAMKDLTEQRDALTQDELWIVQHPPVFTLGQAGKSEHILNAHSIPVVKTDRGGQVTYHGPGQIVIYLLLDIKRLGLGARALVSAMENTIIASLADFGIDGFAKKSAPGVYVKISPSRQTSAAKPMTNDAKIAALGLRIRKGCSYHGMSLNFDMDLQPFSYINPCGYEGQAVTQFADLCEAVNRERLEDALVNHLCQQLQLIAH